MSDTMTTLRVRTVPEVRVCCLRCDAEGTRRGVWVPLDEAQDIFTDEVHRDRIVTLTRGVDLHADAGDPQVLETRHMPVAGPLTDAQVEAWKAVYEAVGEEHWPALLAWVDAGAWVEDGDGLPSTSAFEDRYAGTWKDFEGYALWLAEDTGLTDGWPETAVSYFHWDQWIRDLRHDYTVVDATYGGVHVFRDL